MGILLLSKFLNNVAPQAIRMQSLKDYAGKVVAIDASLSIYQFLIAIRKNGDFLADKNGNSTSHLVGLFYRTLRILETGIKPIYVFDGQMPALKAIEQARREKRREDARFGLENAIKFQNHDDIEKFTKRLIRVDKQQVDDCIELLKLMGVPYLEADFEAETLCCALVKSRKADAVATSDMDALPFGADLVLSNFNAGTPNAKIREPSVKEFNLKIALESLELDQKQFVDLCILMGCDYCEKVSWLGPYEAFKIIKKYKSIGRALNYLEKKYSIPSNWNYQEARKHFLKAGSKNFTKLEFNFQPFDNDGIIEYLCNQRGFSKDKVLKRIEAQHNSSTSKNECKAC